MLMQHSDGQTLIETIVAIFVLTTGLAAGLGLAIYAFGASSEIVERITATGLAREGIEVIRSKRDSNWLAGTLSDCGDGQRCYTTWLNGIAGAAGGHIYKPAFLSNNPGNKWNIVDKASGDFRLYRQADGTFSLTGSPNPPTPFFRKIFIVNWATDGMGNTSQVLVRSVVWWSGKNCAAIADYNPPTLTTNCKVVTEEILTNWKNY